MILDLGLRILDCLMRLGNFAHDLFGHRVVFHIAAQFGDLGLGRLNLKVIGHHGQRRTAIFKMLHQTRFVRIAQANALVEQDACARAKPQTSDCPGDEADAARQ